MKAFAQTAAQTETCAQQDDDSAEVKNVPDTDNVDLQCGDQNEGGEEAESAPTGNHHRRSRAEDRRILFERRNGCQSPNGTDVKVDAMTGSILGTEPTED